MRLDKTSYCQLSVCSTTTVEPASRRVSGLVHLDQHGIALGGSAANAGHAMTAAARAQGVYQVHENAGSAAAYGVSEGNGAAVHVDLAGLSFYSDGSSWAVTKSLWTAPRNVGIFNGREMTTRALIKSGQEARRLAEMTGNASGR